MKTLLLVFGSFIGLVAGNLEFSRTIKNTADDFTFVLKINEGCSSEDSYGSNDCKFDWGQNIEGSLTGELGHDLDEGSNFHVNLKVDTVIPWKFSCPVCGQNCTTTVPIVEQPLNFAMPSCPIKAGELEEAIMKALPTESPTKGIKVTAKGSIVVKDHKDAEVVDMSIDSFMMK